MVEGRMAAGDVGPGSGFALGLSARIRARFR